MVSDPLDLSTEDIVCVNLPNHHFAQYPQLPSFMTPTFDIMTENFHETASDWLHFESSGARHSYPSPGSLGQPMMSDPKVPIRDSHTIHPLLSNLQEEKEKLIFVQGSHDHSDSDRDGSHDTDGSHDSDTDESQPPFAITTLKDACDRQSASGKPPTTPTKPTAMKLRPHVTQTIARSSRPPTWLPGSLEQDRRMLEDCRVPSKKEIPSGSQALTSAKVLPARSMQGSPVSSRSQSSLPTGPKKSNNTPILTSEPPSIGLTDAMKAISSELQSPPSATQIVTIPAHNNDDPELEITIYSKTKAVSGDKGVTNFCLFQGTSNSPVRGLDPQVVLGSGAHTVNVGDIYTHKFTTVSGANSETVQVWMLDAAGMWTDITQALNAHHHIQHPKTDKLALWMRLPSGPPSYVRVDTYKRYLRN